MGSPLGPIFANYYMGHLERQVFEDHTIKPATYCRYVDDIFAVVRDEQHLQLIKERMEESSVLRFTYEMSVDNKLPFLDIEVDGQNGTYVTKVYQAG